MIISSQLLLKLILVTVTIHLIDTLSYPSETEPIFKLSAAISIFLIAAEQSTLGETVSLFTLSF
jgi:hypothetical protein